MRQPRQVAATVFFLTACSALAVGGVTNDSTTAASTKDIELRSGMVPSTLQADSPTQIVIDSIDVDHPVSAVGVDSQQAFSVPEAQLVGWYKWGSAPGMEGSTTLAAHVDFNGAPGAFFRLSEIEIGATIKVASGGTSKTYVVTKARFYGREGLPTDELFAKEGPEVLTLITCGGQFDEGTRSYSDNFVVQATPI